MAFSRNEAAWPPSKGNEDPRFTDLFVEGEADVHVAGVPYDASVLGRKGCRDGPTGIRQAFRFVGGHDTRTGTSLAGLRIKDHGDVMGLFDSDVLAAHDLVQRAVAPLFEKGRVVLVGGDHGLTFPHVAALASQVEGRIGIVVIDAHYDLRPYEGQPTSGTPFRRILEELGGRVQAQNLAEIGIRPYANAASLAAYAQEKGVRVFPMHQVRAEGIEAVTDEALEAAGDGVDHLWLSIDIDGLDQSIASGCSAPGAGGLQWHEAEHVVRRVAADKRCRAMDVLEVAPGLDPTGNTCRTAAQLVGTFCGVR